MTKVNQSVFDVTGVVPAEATNADTVDGVEAAGLLAFSTNLVTTSNVANVWYTNSTSRPRLVTIHVASPASLPIAQLWADIGNPATVNNYTNSTNYNGAWADTNTLIFVVPPGEQYRVRWVSNTGGIGVWFEAD